MSGIADPTVPRVALDTAVLLQALLLGDARAKALRLAWQGGRCTPLIDAAGAQALLRSLAFPALQLSEDEQHEVLADFLPYAEVVSGGAAAGASSQPALELALGRDARADLLVSDCEALRATFARRVSRGRKPACRLLDSVEFFALIQT